MLASLELYERNVPILLCIEFIFYNIHKQRLAVVGWETFFKALSGKEAQGSSPNLEYDQKAIEFNQALINKMPARYIVEKRGNG